MSPKIWPQKLSDFGVAFHDFPAIWLAGGMIFSDLGAG